MKITKMKARNGKLDKWIHYLFNDEECGEFIVDAHNEAECKEILARVGFADPEFICILDEWDYENSPLDVF